MIGKYLRSLLIVALLLGIPGTALAQDEVPEAAQILPPEAPEGGVLP